jgi:hypothetical protein
LSFYAGKVLLSGRNMIDALPTLFGLGAMRKRNYISTAGLR